MMQWLAEHLWVAWLTLAALLAVAEMLTLDFTLLMLAVGALAGGLDRPRLSRSASGCRSP